MINETIHKIDGLTFHAVKTEKYKTNTISLKFKAPLQEEVVTKRALLPYVLQSETVKYPSTTLLRRYLDDLYGSTLHVDLSKKGEYHIISFNMEIANELYLSDRTPLLMKAIELLGEIIFSPVTDGDAFNTETVNKEKRSLKQRIQAVYDDKMRYSNLRLVQEMCKNEPYHLHVNGRIEDLDEISASSLFQYYQKVLKEDEVDLYLVGNFDTEEVIKNVGNYFTFNEREKQELTSQNQSKEITSENEVIERQDVKQGKLNLGYRTNTRYGDPDYNALQVFNGIFGGFSHSKLFLNVREKNSLAYYAASRVESHKGLLMVMSGIEFENYEKAVTIIKEQMEAMKNGEITDAEIDQTKAVIRNQLLETVDTPRGVVEIFYHNVVSAKAQKLDTWIEGIEAVTKDEIVQVAQKVELDTIYFLTGLEASK